MLLRNSIRVFKVIVIILGLFFLLVHSEDRIINNEVIEVISANDSKQYPDYSILFSIDIIKNNSAFNSSFNNSDFIIVDDSGLSNMGKINFNISKTKGNDSIS
ncbi:uncharacterized protein LOC135836546 [Planococcus citri]|uniref:uncharacterized protein LOC135836546 n=1 Tax=Planococcus citri TaxID=170843 RepID=UPI0031F7DFCF